MDADTGMDIMDMGLDESMDNMDMYIMDNNTDMDVVMNKDSIMDMDTSQLLSLAIPSFRIGIIWWKGAFMHHLYHP